MLPSADSPAVPARVAAGGKWLCAGGDKWLLQGVTYGPFPPGQDGRGFPDPALLEADFARIRGLGFNTVRLYEPPTRAVLRSAEAHGLRLLVGLPWTDHVDFLRDRRRRAGVEAAVLEAVGRLRDEAGVAGFLIGNEIEKTLVRWLGPPRVQRFLERLIDQARALAPACLFSYATYPSTEYLIPRNADFLAVNLYLEQPQALAAYLDRLQNLAGNKPLVITEFGLDTATHGEAAQAEAWRWFHATASQAAVAGTVWFSYSDEWFRGGERVEGWRFGLVDRDRRERPACALMARAPAAAPEPRPRISVIVCTHNGGATLRPCLASLQRLNYPDYEVLVIDDGSSDDIAGIAAGFAGVRCVRQAHAGLSAARNRGAELATGEILAYTDDDCLADPDWLRFLAAGFDDPCWVAVGGPNIPPPPRNRIEAVVAAAPGAPAHVLIDDTEAEHLPGCNLAIRRSALAAIGGFRVAYRVAGDDVDVCWRLRAAGGRLRFAPGAMVWHHRRYRVRAYLRQQRGYGHAEALLMRDHPERFGPLGGARWCGGIYGDRLTSACLAEGRIFHGPQGRALFQGIYRPGPHCLLDWLGGVAWLVAGVALLPTPWPWLAGGCLLFSLTLAVCRLRGLPRPPFRLRGHERLLLLALAWLQPVVRETQRLLGMLDLGVRPGAWPAPGLGRADTPPATLGLSLGEQAFWSEQGQGRDGLLARLRELLEAELHSVRGDEGWRRFDLEVEPQAEVSTAFLTVTEHHGGARCLTRVRSLLRLQPAAILAGMGIAGLLALADPRWAGLLALLAGGGWLWRRQAARRRVLQAARTAGLAPLTE